MLFNKVDFIQQSINSKLIHFDELALQLYHHQLKNNVILQEYHTLTNKIINPKSINNISFLPVSFFKNQQVKTGEFTPQVIYTSSTTSGGIPSKHFVADKSIYAQSYLTAFKHFYGDPKQYVFLCLLPNYLERDGSSLIDMAQGLIEASNQTESGFYLYDFDKLATTIKEVLSQNKRIFLLGVTFALLDFAEQFPMDLQYTIVMETGGMKGRKQEQTRIEIHDYLKNQFNITTIHSEYGMTELLSQGYSKGEGVFECAPWMKVVITDLNDPFTLMPTGKAGIINVIDLANVDSCAFIETQDLGRLLANGCFEVLGRMDNTEVRGCNLMYV
ncbi:MAG: acyl transferase [Bacteroidia bacterium]|nr:acyl transferase [Bacteroidia bacterium]